ncbi:response regulator [Pelosinus baikalensis]|uniref:Response regulator n=1 Tax=Pelosinus baikalensis TaxID=2892015 RepID=A0ABS8HVA0_9FIRM|nr:response regulator [Pelosinus baikalensis]MCC5466439.1 response regulator [Pelosinus baikalensis]
MKNSILIVDDLTFNRKQIKAVLKDMQQIEFYDAEDGFQAIKEVEDNDIDLIILDLMMPGKDGFDVLRELKADAKYKDIPIIVYSGMDNIDSINQALELGAYDYFSKPLTMEQIQFVVPVKVKNALDSYVQRKALLRMHEKMKLELMLANVLQQTLIATSKKDHWLICMVNIFLVMKLVGIFMNVYSLKTMSGLLWQMFQVME